MTLIEKYRSLPFAGDVPDCVWDTQMTLSEIDRLDAQRQELSDRLIEQSVKMTEHLKTSWTVAELQQVGLMAGTK